MRYKTKVSQGFVLFDVLLGLFIFSLGFAALFGLTERAVFETQQATTLMEVSNLAQEIMDRLTAQGWSEIIATGACLPGGIVDGNTGRFHWRVRSDWENNPQLLRVSVEVSWSERGRPFGYKLESLYAVD